VALSLFVAALGCGPGRTAPPAPAAAAPPPNILLISIDSLRADHLGIYGYGRDTSPNLDRLARQGAYFARAWSTTSWTLPSHSSMMSSLEPASHGVNRGYSSLVPGVVLLPEALSSAGYRTAGVVSVVYLSGRFGFDQGWDEYDDHTYAEEAPPSTKRRSTEIVARRAREMLDGFGDQRFFLFLHFFDVHYDYVPPPPYDGMFDPAARGGIDDQRVLRMVKPPDDLPPDLVPRLEALYDGEIRSLDEALGGLLAELDRRGIADDTLVMVTADHGDEFLDHGRLGHMRNLYDSTLRVPLIVRWPNGGLRGGRIDTPVSLLDVAPTLARAAGADRPAQWQGRDLVDLLQDGEPPPPLELVPLLVGGGKALIDDGRFKLIAHKGRRGRDDWVQLFDLVADPAERHDLSNSRRELAARLLARLSKALRRQHAVSLRPGDVRSDGKLREELHALGYI